MRFLKTAAVVVVSFAALTVAIESSPANELGWYSTYYSSPVVYYQSYMPAYTSSPMYSASYWSGSQSAYGVMPAAYTTYYSYSAPMAYHQPCVPAYSYSAPRSYRQPYSSQQPSYGAQQPYGSQRSYAPQRSARPTTMVNVGAYDNRFEPQTINVQPGTTVKWMNYGQHDHTVTANDDRWDSGDIKPGASYSATFNHPGTYYYYCRHHAQDKMRGTIVVGGAPASGGYGAPAGGGYGGAPRSPGY